MQEGVTGTRGITLKSGTMVNPGGGPPEQPETRKSRAGRWYSSATQWKFLGLHVLRPSCFVLFHDLGTGAWARVRISCVGPPPSIPPPHAYSAQVGLGT